MAARIWSRLAWSAAGLALYAPIPLLAAFPHLAPDDLDTRALGVPAGVHLVVLVIVGLVLLTWICGAFAEPADEDAPP